MNILQRIVMLSMIIGLAAMFSGCKTLSPQDMPKKLQRMSLKNDQNNPMVYTALQRRLASLDVKIQEDPLPSSYTLNIVNSKYRVIKPQIFNSSTPSSFDVSLSTTFQLQDHNNKIIIGPYTVNSHESISTYSNIVTTIPNIMQIKERLAQNIADNIVFDLMKPQVKTIINNKPKQKK